MTSKIEGFGECPVCHLHKDEIYDEDLYKHLRLYHSKEDLAKYIFDFKQQLDCHSKYYHQ